MEGIIAIGVLLVLFSILGVKLTKKPKLKKLDPKKTWGKPGEDLDQWCIRNPNAKITLVWLAQITVQFFQLVWWLIFGLFIGIFKKALKH